MPRETKAARTCGTCGDEFPTRQGREMHELRKQDRPHKEARGELERTDVDVHVDDAQGGDDVAEPPTFEVPEIATPTPLGGGGAADTTEPVSPDETSPEQPPSSEVAPPTPPRGEGDELQPGDLYDVGAQADVDVDEDQDVLDLVKSMNRDELMVAADTTCDVVVDVAIATVNARLKPYQADGLVPISPRQIESLKAAWRPVFRKHASKVVTQPEVLALVVTGAVIAPPLWSAHALAKEKRELAKLEAQGEARAPLQDDDEAERIRAAVRA